MRFSRAARVAKSLVSPSGARAFKSPSATASAVDMRCLSGRSTSRVTRWRPNTTNTPTSSATSAITNQNSSPEAIGPATAVVATPTSSAAAAKKDR